MANRAGANDLQLFYEALVCYLQCHGDQRAGARADNARLRWRLDAALQYWTFARRKAELVAHNIDAGDDIRDALYWLPETVTIDDKGDRLVVRANGEYRGVVHRGDADHRGQQWIALDNMYIDLSGAVAVMLMEYAKSAAATEEWEAEQHGKEHGDRP